MTDCARIHARELSSPESRPADTAQPAASRVVADRGSFPARTNLLGKLIIKIIRLFRAPIMPTHLYRRIGLLLLAATAACYSRAREHSGALAPRLSTPTYDGTVSVDPATRRVNANWRINFRRTAQTADSVILLLNRSLLVTRLTGADVKSFTERVDEGLKHLTVQLAPVGRNDSVSTIEIAYNGVPGFGSDTINGISERWIELGLDSFWHPVFSDFSQSIVGNVRLNIPAGLTPVTSGSVTRNGGTVELVSTVPLIDIPFVASPDIREVKGDRVSVYHAAEEKPELVSKTLSTSTSCAKYLDERYSTAQRPLAPVKMVIAPRGGPGYARKNYIVITRTADT